MKKNKLDHVDCEILNLLSKNGRMSVKDLANEVFLSSPAASARVERLEKEGYITGYKDKIPLSDLAQPQGL